MGYLKPINLHDPGATTRSLSTRTGRKIVAASLLILTVSATIAWFGIPGLAIYRNIAVGSHIDQDTQDHIPPTSDHDSFAGRASSLALALMSGRSVVAEGIQ